MMKSGCLIVSIICIIRVSYGGRLTGNCLAKNGTCGKKGVSCDNTFGEGWIDTGNCCYGKPCCKIVIKDLCRGTSYRCGFELNSEPCVFSQAAYDDFDWTRHSNSTPSPNTGPAEAAEGTYYLYIEASDNAKGDKTILTTEATNLQACPYCLSFKYHMYGRDTGSLEVFAGDKTSSLSSIWRKLGQQINYRDYWETTTIDIPQSSNLGVTIVGLRGRDFKGDIAIDDILLKAGACSN